MRLRFVGTIVFSLLTFGGCGESIEQPVAVPLDKVPSSVMEVARKNTPQGVTLDSARQFTLNGEEVYEVRGKDRCGKIHEVEVTAAGKLLEIE